MKLQRRWGFSLLRPRDESKSIVGKTSPLERINLPFENKLLISAKLSVFFWAIFGFVYNRRLFFAKTSRRVIKVQSRTRPRSLS